VGGDKGAVEAVRPLFERMGKNINHLGPAGSGQHTKMVGLDSRGICPRWLVVGC
jgi:3-hydroxyisobutyrate dehydrogenase-like beta-hydroxyacid dehydrogenase